MKKIIHTKDCVENQSTQTRTYLICYKWHLCGGYTHSSYVFTDTVLHDVDSFDECSAYPYTLVTNRFPMSSFRKCNITKRKQMTKRFAYLIVVRFFDLKCKYLNHFISGSKCYEIKGAKYDNGRIYECKECKMVLTDVDFYFILDTHKCKKYIIEECYFSKYDYLPIQYINFVLDKYENKTKYKDDESKKLQYQKEKNKYNAIFRNDGHQYNQKKC